MFNRLAVFRGGFDLAAAEAVCSGGVVDEIHVVDLLDRLVDKSMIMALGSGDHSRYRLLETLRTVAETKLSQAGESDEVRDRHVRYYGELIAEWGAKVRSTEQPVALGVLNADRYFDQAIEAAAGVVIHVEVTARLLRGLFRTCGDREAAIRSLRECIDQAERHSVMPNEVADAYEGIALAWLEDGKVERAATLAVAVQRLREAIGASGDTEGAPTRQALKVGLAEALDDETRQRAESAGAAMSRDEMRRYVLES